MLHAPVTEKKNKAESINSAMLAEREQQNQAVNWSERFSSTKNRSDSATIQQAYGNQGVLRMLRTEKGRSPSINPMQGSVLQRKCACGSAAGAAGTCAACQEKQALSLQTKSRISEPGDRYEQEVDRIAAQIMKIPGTTSPIGKKDNVADIKRMSSFSLSKQIPPGEEEVGEDYLDRFLQDESVPEQSEEDLAPQTLQDVTILPGRGSPIRFGSGTCMNGGGSSTCNLNTGLYEITANDNTCCTKNCTQRHELQHVIDHTSWGCCKKFSEELKTNADTSAVKRAYKQWFDRVAPLTECHAYGNDMKCIKEMEKAKDCKGKGATSECCADIADYKTRYSRLEQEYCSKAPPKAPPCPRIFI